MNTDQIDQIHVKYKQSFYTKAATLKSLWEFAEQNPYELREFLHKLTGSSGMYGYNDISEQAEKIKRNLTLLVPISRNFKEYKKLYQLLIDHSKE